VEKDSGEEIITKSTVASTQKKHRTDAASVIMLQIVWEIETSMKSKSTNIIITSQKPALRAEFSG